MCGLFFKVLAEENKVVLNKNLCELSKNNQRKKIVVLLNTVCIHKK